MIIINGVIQDARDEVEDEEIGLYRIMCFVCDLDFHEVTQELVREYDCEDYCELCLWDYLTYIEQFEETWKKLIEEIPYMESLSTRDMFFKEDS